MKTTLSLSIALGLAVVACGNNNNNSPDGGTAAPAPAFTLSTTAFTPGGTIPADNTCHGANTSPDLAWTNAPSGAKSFAVVLTDKTATLTHWVIYNIPATATSLPANVDNAFQPTKVAGAQQTTSVMPNVTGYFGPCPPAPSATDNGLHTYQFTVYALDVPALTRPDNTSTADDGLAFVTIHAIGSASFTGNYTSPATTP